MDFKQYIRKDILAWLSYNENYEGSYGGVNRVCYVYPRVVIKDNTYDLINSNDFPKYGRIEVRIQGEDSANDIYLRFGSLVKIKINKDSYPNYEGNNMYSLKYNSQFSKDNSEIWIELFSGKAFYQIIDVESNIEILQKDSSIPEPNCTICTTLIFLRCDSKLYGPFEYDIKEGTMMLRGIKDYQYTVGEYIAVDYNDELLVIADEHDKEAIIIIPKSALTSPEKTENNFDWISQETLIDNFMEYLHIENGYTREQFRQLKEMAHQLIESSSDVHFTEKRILRIQDLINIIFQKEKYVQDMIQFALSDESIKDILVNELLCNHFDQIQNRIKEFSAMQDRLAELKVQEVSMEQHIQKLQFEAETKKQATSEIDKNEIDKLTKAIEELRKKNEALSEKNDLHEEIDKLKAERDNFKKERDIEREKRDQQLVDNKELEKQFNSTLEAFNDQAKQTARILDSKLLDKILRGVGEDPEDGIVPFDPSLLHTDPMNCFDIINRITVFISDKAHRDVTNNDVANYLICISQGFITTFAGEPGTGKTSLCNILAKALGLMADVPQRRFIDISVERGWSSHKDFIGYYNPLTKSMEKSNMEVFNAFAKMDYEYECDQSNIAPFVILLDEANLSPLEHYWASFLRNCDFTSVSNRSIALGGNNSFKIPEHLRFLATVNFDHTTEELSPRFLDRSWVIMLDPSRIDDREDEDIENTKDMISFGAMKEAFCVRENDEIDEAILNKWNAIQKIFKERSLQIIMPRNLKMVKNYCAVGCRCMERDTPVTKLAPLDYAFAQKILPVINGTGENFRMLIDDLMKECTAQNMPISAKHLERMKRVAENNMGFYQFFSH